MNFNDKLVKDHVTELWDKIYKARNWALAHFNARDAENTAIIDRETFELVKPSFFVEFPEPDEMVVSPSVMGKPCGIWVSYRLCFCGDGSTEWVGINPMRGTEFPPLRVK